MMLPVLLFGSSPFFHFSDNFSETTKRSETIVFVFFCCYYADYNEIYEQQKMIFPFFSSSLIDHTKLKRNPFFGVQLSGLIVICHFQSVKVKQFGFAVMFRILIILNILEIKTYTVMFLEKKSWTL